ncbi:MAG: DNA polymerase I [Magnetococcales bacterium]|nr:DNA polymerase I [Magnetococcales bacterium]MBF0115137.1 DNA polymerase I [Magnetococcales bacterium]
MPPRLFLIDASGFIYRAFYAVREMTRRDGFPTNAIFGFVKMIRRLLDTHQPDHMVMVFDGSGPTKRHEMDVNYKANRKSMPDALRTQIPIIEKIIQAWGISSQRSSGYEADDLLGTMTRIAEQAGWQVVIVSSDKDLMQLVSAAVTLWDPAKEIWIREPEVIERWGVEPKKVVHVMALAGDSSDNIPGVPRIGDKIAAQLMQGHATLEELLSNLAGVAQAGRRQLLGDHAEQARLSLRLVTIIQDAPLDDFTLAATRLQRPDWVRLRQLFLEMEFSTLVRELDRQQLATQPELPLLGTPQAEPEPAPLDYQTISDWPSFEHFLQALAAQPFFSLDTETTHLSAAQAELVGLSFSWADRQAYYLPVGHTLQAAPHGQLDRAAVLAALKPLLEDEGRKKIGQNIKYECVVLAKYGIRLAGLQWDAMLLSHLLHGGGRRHNLDAMAMDLLQRTTITFKEVTGSGKSALRFDQVPLAQAAPYACEDAEVTWTVARQLADALQAIPSLQNLYQTVELPLVQVLADMELAGVRIDREILAEMSQRFTQQRQALVGEIHALAGESFNVNSTQQLGEILFGKLQLPGGKRTKTGYSTDIEVLTALAEQGHLLPERVIQYRSLTKLQTTYTDALPQLIHPGTGRLHTHYNQAATLTGRLSSSEPNLQNIPIRTEEGRAIRTAFFAPPGCVLLSADYSQIELRLLAHLGAVVGMQEAFAQDRDIHAATAAELFGGTGETVSTDARRMAKTINFGLIYGMSPFGLAKRLGISNPQARAYMERYFQRYQGVREHMEQTVALARRQGYVETIAGRRCWLREIHSSDRTLREFAERTAINAPLQGSAADLIKLAMLRLHARLCQEGWRSRMVLQVHDELVLEVPEEELEKIREVVREAMEGVMQLSVPLKVDIGVGHTWAEAH